MKLDITGMSDVRWAGVGICPDGEMSFIYSIGEVHLQGVGMMMTSNIVNCMLGYWPVSDRIMMVKLAGKQRNKHHSSACAHRRPPR